MKVSSFTLGAVAGISAIALAIPVIAQISSAESNSSSTPSGSAPSQACVLALAEKDTAQLSSIDALIAAQKTALTAHREALNAAAGITDDAQRTAAVQKANQDLRTAMQTAMQSQGDRKAQMDALKEACGGSAGFGGHMGGGMMGFGGPGEPGMRGRGPGLSSGKLAEELGMTADELQAALDGGKTIEQIAEEQGITLPDRPGKGRHGGWMMGGQPPAETSSASSQQ